MDDTSAITFAGEDDVQAPAQQPAQDIPSHVDLSFTPPASEQEQQIAGAYHHYREHAEEYFGPESFDYFLRRTPVGGTAESIAQAVKLHGAASAAKEGTATPEHLQTIAQHLARQDYEASKSGTGQGVIDMLTHVPAIAGEFAMTGGLAGAAKEGAAAGITRLLGTGAESMLGRAAVAGGAFAAGTAAQTAAMPSMWIDQAVSNNEQAGRLPLDPKGLASGYGLGMAQMATLNVIGLGTGKLFAESGAMQALGRVGTQFVTGPFAQAATDATTHLMGLSTGWGSGEEILDKMKSGDIKGAFADATVTALQYAAFAIAHEAGGHEAPKKRPEVLDAFERSMKRLAASGMSKDAAGEAMNYPSRVLRDLLTTDPEAGREQATREMRALPDGPIRDWGLALANVIPDKTPEADLALFQGLGIEAPKAPANPPAKMAEEGEPPGKAPEGPPASPAAQAAVEPPKFENARQEADYVEKQHLQALGEIRDAQLNERAVKQMVDMGFPKQKDYEAAVARRTEANKELRRIQKQLDAVRVKAAAEKPRADPSAPETTEDVKARFTELSGKRDAAWAAGDNEAARTIGLEITGLIQKHPDLRETSVATKPRQRAPEPEDLASQSAAERTAAIQRQLEHAQQQLASADAESKSGWAARVAGLQARLEAPQHEAHGPTPGIDEPTPVRDWMMARLRAKNQAAAAQGTQYAGAEGGTRQPEVVQPKEADFIRGMPMVNDGVYDLGALSKHERYVLDRIFGDNASLATLAADNKLPTVNTPASVSKMAVRALNKLGLELPNKFDPNGKPIKLTAERLKLAVAEEARDRLAKHGVVASLDEIMHNPDEVAKRIREQAEENLTRAGRWANFITKEVVNEPGGRWTTEQLAEFDEAISNREEPPGYAPAKRPGREDASATRVPEGQAPLQPAAAGELQQGLAPGAAVAGPQAAAQSQGGPELAAAGRGPIGGNELTIDSPFHPKNLKAAALEIQGNDRANVQRYNEALRTARTALKKYGNEVNHVRSERIEDATDIRGLDQVAEYLKEEYPDLFPSNKNSDDALFDMLKAGNKRIMTADEARSQAEAWAHGQADKAEVAQTNGQLDKGAFKRLTPADIEWAEGQARREVAEEAGVSPEDLGGPAESDRLGQDTDTDFPFGANAPAGGPAGAESAAPSPAPGDGNTPADRGVRGAVDTFVHDEAGSLNLQRMKELAVEAKDKAQVVWDNAIAGLREAAGQSFPRAHALAQAVGNALSQLASSQTYVKRAVPYYIDKVMGPGATEETRKLWGATFGELRVRYAKAAWLANGDQASAGAVTSFIGMKDSPLTTEKQFQQVANSPEFRGMLKRYKAEFVDIMEGFFKKAQGMDPNDPIASFTQIPGYPVQFSRVDEATPSKGAGGSARGSLKGQQARKLKAAEAAGLDAKQYQVDMGSIIENTLQSRVELANKAEVYRQIEAHGLGEWRIPGPHRVDGENGPLVEIAGVRPPRGTQEAQPGQTSLYVDPKIENEVRKALDLNPKGPLTQAASIVTKPFTSLGLASTVEVAYHSLNQITFAFTKPGVRIGDIWKNSIERWNNTPEFQAKLMELARIGAMKPSYHEGAPSFLKAGARLLDGIGDVMRATAGDAFDRLVEGGAVNTEQNKRDFINQLGQYERRAQNGAVAWLRDSGIGPFATAGTNYLTQGVRTLWLDPGLKFNTNEQALKARANVLGRIATGMALTAAANYLAWGRIDGDEKTPIGSIKVGESNGKSITVDLSGPFLWKRGLRSIGLLAMMEGERGGRQEGSSFDRAVEDVQHAVLHPAMGPAAQFVKTALTGTNSIGIPIATKAKTGESQRFQDVKAAVANVNPVVGALGGFNASKEKPTSERLAELLGPYGPRWHAKPVASPARGRR